MPIVRFDPPEYHATGKKRAVADAARVGTAALVGGPVGALLAGIKALTGGRTSMEVRHAYHTAPIEVNTDTGEIRALAVTGGSKHDNRKQTERGQRAVEPLKIAYFTGVVPKNLPSGYKEIARQVAQLRDLTPPELDEPAPPAQDVPAFKQFDYDEDFSMPGFLPPGGLTGFAQMTPASKLALMGTRRGRATGTRRKRRKTKAKTRKRTKTRSRKKARLVKGSAAAKRYMASIRRKRKRA